MLLFSVDFHSSPRTIDPMDDPHSIDFDDIAPQYRDTRIDASVWMPAFLEAVQARLAPLGLPRETLVPLVCGIFEDAIAIIARPLCQRLEDEFRRDPE